MGALAFSAIEASPREPLQGLEDGLVDSRAQYAIFVLFVWKGETWYSKEPPESWLMPAQQTLDSPAETRPVSSNYQFRQM